MKRANRIKIALSLCVVAIVAVASGVFTACVGQGAQKDLVISGSTSVMEALEKLAPAFMEKNKDIRIIPDEKDSTIGVQNTVKGFCEIGMVSRDLKESEKEQVEAITACMDGIVLIVNNACAIESATSEQVFALYAEQTPIVGADYRVDVPVSRESESGTFGAFGDLVVGDDGIKLSATANKGLCEISYNSNGLLKTAIQNDVTANKIGYISLGILDDSVKAVAFNGVAATVDNIKSGAYKLARPFNFVVKKGAQLSDAAQRFIDFVRSEEGIAILEANGYVGI